MAYNVQFKFGTKAKYDAITTKDSNTLYFLDNGQLYKGNKLYGGTYQEVASFPSTGVQGVLYINSTDLSVKFWNGTAYKTVVPPIVKAIDSTSTDGQLATAKAVYQAVLGAGSTQLDAAKEYADSKATSALTDAKAYTDTEVANLVGSAPDTLDTIQELAMALENNADILDVLRDAIGVKADKTYVDTELSKKADTTTMTTAIATAKSEAITAAGTAADSKISAKVGNVGNGTVKTYVDSAVKGVADRVDAIEEAGYATTQQVATAKSEAITSATTTAASDATTKANQALNSAKSYADGLASNYDAAGSATTALSNAKSYTDTALTWVEFS